MKPRLPSRRAHRTIAGNLEHHRLFRKDYSRKGLGVIPSDLTRRRALDLMRVAHGICHA
ncbi:hypothetical protein [Nocardia yamanashiensis]|uniref:hypothetical protein n=1 Tax=Nocardia yamanashiensis TaxID=209247 RepID=UPI000A5429F8|nr:hypothetical protein [Nocardia yamanashiensis]